MKTLYGFVEYELLWYDLYTKKLKSHSLNVNPYDIFIANSTIYGKQCMVAWYVDDNKFSHVDEEVNINIIETIAGYFG